jgi:hypothetical protein
VKRWMFVLAAAAALLAAPVSDARSEKARIKSLKEQVRKSRTVVRWWDNRGEWALAPKRKWCWSFIGDRRERVCLMARRDLRAHQERLAWAKDRLDAIYDALIAERRPTIDYWVGRQIWAADIIGSESAGDPWPNCPDPHDGSGSSWYDTVNCENGGNWYDSPGYYRCGLQFDPMWERRFGRLCP